MPDSYTKKANTGVGENPISDEETYVDNATDRSPVKAGQKPTSGIGPEQTSGSATRDPESIVVGELMNKLLDNNADMIKLDLQIVGDPDWIQQDNVLYDVTKLPAGQKTLSNGSISYFDSITCFQFNFKSPLKDYDDSTGMFEVEGAGQSAIFSGVYQVLKVINSFNRGKFTQKLDNVRVRVQSSNQVAANRAAAGAQPPADANRASTPTAATQSQTNNLAPISQNGIDPRTGAFIGPTGTTSTPTFQIGA